MEEQRRLLDELMGANRNRDRDVKPIEHFDDPRVCKYSLAGLCPYRLFPNTVRSRLHHLLSLSLSLLLTFLLSCECMRSVLTCCWYRFLLFFFFHQKCDLGKCPFEVCPAPERMIEMYQEER